MSRSAEKDVPAVPDYRPLWCGELREPETGRYVSGWGVILSGADVPADTLVAALQDYHGAGTTLLASEVQHLHYMPRVKRCSKYDGWGCDNEGEWHAHWFGVKHNDAAPDCCYTLALGTRPIPPAKGDAQ